LLGICSSGHEQDFVPSVPSGTGTPPPQPPGLNGGAFGQFSYSRCQRALSKKEHKKNIVFGLLNVKAVIVETWSEFRIAVQALSVGVVSVQFG
jgi:hypothetical protein